MPYRTGPNTNLGKNNNLMGQVVLASLLIFSITCFSVMHLSAQTSSAVLPTASAQIGIQEMEQKLLASLSLTPITLSSLSFSSLSSSSSSSSISTSSASQALDPDDFRLSYSKLAVSNASYLRILYDSKTSSSRLNNISTTSNNDDESGRLSLSQQLSQRQSNMQISDSDSSNLRQMIENGAFFQLDSAYLPSNKSAKDSYDALYVLTIEMGDNLHTVTWTDNSDNIPASLLSIANMIEKINSR